MKLFSLSHRFFFLFIGLFFLTSSQAQEKEFSKNLSGLWRFQLDPMGFGKTPGSELYLDKLVETIMLPGSTDQAGKGIKNPARYVDRLSRKFEYKGAAWYQREVTIPASWSKKGIVLKLEICHWETTVYIDGIIANVGERLSTPNYFNLTKWLTPGVHTITLCVDNNLKYPMDQWAHGITEYTQTNWNGIVGDISLNALEKARISKLNVFPNLKDKNIKVKIQFTNHSIKKGIPLNLNLREKNGKLIFRKSLDINSIQFKEGVEIELPLGKNFKLWDEFNPFLYELEANLGKTSKTTTFGMREVEQGKHHIRLNGRNIHLRGALDCAVFPITGYPSVNVKDWKKILSTLKEYGMNHLRFHSWCPPEAAFIAGDEIGIYLQVELPMWIKDAGKYPARRHFFEKEMYAILDEYGNHPSFILMCNGNENEGDFSVLEDLVKKGQAYDSRRLYSASTARTHVPSDEYYVSHVTSKGWITVYEGKPSTDWDRSKTSDIDVPVIAHETGQRCMYPNFDEIKKYTGVLEARNFEVFRERLTKHRMLPQAKDFFKATGKHTVLQYKEVNESLLRTRNSGGFQLLGLSDFPGQGSAFVGILDAFWDSKGLVTPEKFRESCAPSVLLARLPKRVFHIGDSFNCKMEIYHYGDKPLRKNHLRWELVNEDGKIYQQGKIRTPQIAISSVRSLGTLSIPLKNMSKAQKLTLKVNLKGIKNEWDIWVYPTKPISKGKDITIAHAWNKQVKKELESGKNVLLIPRKCKGRKTRFASHFWNPIMFNWDPMIVGTLVQNTHAAFSDFPTKEYADWQWWDILNHSTALNLDAFDNITPIIQSIDSYESNHKLGIAFEAKVSKGKLFVLCMNTEKDMKKRWASKQLLYSIEKYVSSDKFEPKTDLSEFELDKLFSTPSIKEKVKISNKAIDLLRNK